MRARAVFLVGIAVAAVASEQKAQIVVPTLGFVTGEAQLRPMLGSRSFPAIGEAVALHAGATRILLASRQEYALVESADGWSAVPVGGSSFAAVPILNRQARVAALSPSGTSAAFLFAGSDTIVAVSGLPSSPRVVFESGVDEGVISLAVSDDARLVLAGRPGAVMILRPDEAAASARADLPSAIAFVPNSTRALIVDRETHQIMALDVTASGTVVSRLAGRSEGIDSPVALALNARGSSAVVLNRSSVVVLPLNGGDTRILRCDFMPAEVTSLAEDRLFGIRGEDGSGTWLLRTDTPEPVLLYAPAVGR